MNPRVGRRRRRDNRIDIRGGGRINRVACVFPHFFAESNKVKYRNKE